jgi:hypothetical protein
MTGFKKRPAAVASWTIAFLGRGRRQRVIIEQTPVDALLTGQQVSGRLAGGLLPGALWMVGGFAQFVRQNVG